MLYTTGSVLNSVKVAKLQAEWESKENKAIRQQNEKLTPEERMLRKYEEDFRKMNENRRISEIYSKIASGAALSAEELEYLRRNDPETAAEYERGKNEQEAYKKELRNCKTKEEAERLKHNKMGFYAAEAGRIANNPVIPKAKKMTLLQRLLGKVTGINEAHLEFTRTAAYAELPTEAELRADRKAQSEAKKPEITHTDNALPENTEDTTVQNDETASFQDVKEIVRNYFEENRVVGSGELVLDNNDEPKNKGQNNLN